MTNLNMTLIEQKLLQLKEVNLATFKTKKQNKNESHHWTVSFSALTHTDLRGTHVIWLPKHHNQATCLSNFRWRASTKFGANFEIIFNLCTYETEVDLNPNLWYQSHLHQLHRTSSDLYSKPYLSLAFVRKALPTAITVMHRLTRTTRIRVFATTYT